MKLDRDHRDRDETEVAVLEALADRGEEGMTLFELRSVLGVDIDGLETALSGLQDSGLVTVEQDDSRVVFVVEAAAVADETDEDPGFFEWLREKFGGR
jgi:DNA-binding MarR family transcriptional regulator